MFENFSCFPLTQQCIKKGYNRYNEPIVPEEVGYCGPPNRPCIDCYLCLSPICIPIDIITFCSFQIKNNNIEIIPKNKEYKISEV